MAKVYCYTCKDYRNYSSNGRCENCNEKHPTSQHGDLNITYLRQSDEEVIYDGLPHDSDCFWID